MADMMFLVGHDAVRVVVFKTYCTGRIMNLYDSVGGGGGDFEGGPLNTGGVESAFK
jgi:hypothetical protein